MLLRNISNNQNTTALNDFSNVCEPLKVYSRNKGGTEYQMYSPLTLFADACTPDAEDALGFDTAVNLYLHSSSTENKAMVLGFLNKWIATNEGLVDLSKNAPLVQPLLPLSKSLSNLSKQTILIVEKNEKTNVQLVNDLLEKCNSKDNADVELAVCKSFKKLLKI